MCVFQANRNMFNPGQPERGSGRHQVLADNPVLVLRLSNPLSYCHWNWEYISNFFSFVLHVESWIRRRTATMPRAVQGLGASYDQSIQPQYESHPAVRYKCRPTKFQ